MVKKGKEGKEMGRAMKFFTIKIKNKMSIVKGNHGKKGKNKQGLNTCTCV